MAKPRSTGNRLQHILILIVMYAILIVGAAIMLLPFGWMFTTSIMTLGEANTGRLLPRAARLTCPHVNLDKTVEGSVTGFAVSPKLAEGVSELPTDSYYVEIRQEEGGGQWQFRLVNNQGKAVEIGQIGRPGGPFTADWQPLPPAGGPFDTERGLTITFAPAGAYTVADRRSGAARVDYVNCCQYPTWMVEKQLAEQAERRYTGPEMSDDLTTCRTFGHQISYFFLDFLGSNYWQAWTAAKFGKYLFNSIIITGITIIGTLIFSTLAAYAFARIEFPGRNAIFALLLSTLMIPATVTMIPNFLTITGNNPLLPFINWYDKLAALTVPFMTSFFDIFLLRQFFAQIPHELWDAAQIDGAGHLRFLFKVVLPLSKAPIMTVVIFNFITSWNSLLWPLIATRAGSRWWPIAVGLQNFVSEAGPETHLWMAGATISMLPVLILYLIAQRQFIEGIATTGLKG